MEYRSNLVMQFSWEGDNIGGTDRFAGKTYTDTKRAFVLDGPQLLRVLEFAIDGQSQQSIVSYTAEEFDLSTSEAEELIESLIEKNFLLPANHHIFEGATEWFDKRWRRALYFHLGTRNVDYSDRNTDAPEGTKTDVLAEYSRTESPPSVYPDRFEETEAIDLPPSRSLPETPVDEVLLNRRTHRSFSGESISRSELSSLLYHAFDPVREIRDTIATADDALIQTRQSHHLQFEVYPVVIRGEGIDEGVYHYSIRDHSLHPIRPDFFRDSNDADELVGETIVGQRFADGASLACYITACFERYQWRYRHSRALKSLYTEIPAHAHRLLLVATALGLRTFLTPAQRDEMVDDLLKLDGYREASVYFTGFGH